MPSAPSNISPLDSTAPAEAGQSGTRQGDVVLQVEHLKVHIPLAKSAPWDRREFVHAVDDVSFDLRSGETLGIVGSRAAERPR